MEGLSDGATLVRLLLWFNSKRNGCFGLPLTPGMIHGAMFLAGINQEGAGSELLLHIGDNLAQKLVLVFGGVQARCVSRLRRS